MEGKILRQAAVILSLGVAVASAGGAQGFTSAHWKSKVEIEGGRAGSGRMPSDYEIWFQSGKTRMKANAAGVAMNMLKVGDDLYTWADGQTTGMKMNVAAAQRQNRPSQDYVGRIEEFKSKGKKVGSETLDGHPCDIYEYDAEHGSHGRYWLARDLHDFPVKALIEQNGVKVTYHNVEIEVPASVPNSMMEVPKDVEFRDIAEMMKGMKGKED